MAELSLATHRIGDGLGVFALDLGQRHSVRASTLGHPGSGEGPGEALLEHDVVGGEVDDPREQPDGSRSVALAADEVRQEG